MKKKNLRKKTHVISRTVLTAMLSAVHQGLQPVTASHELALWVESPGVAFCRGLLSRDQKPSQWREDEREPWGGNRT